uniref:Uncharacterized protein n=1 Tax=Vitrella brassicaformis TaxID=1169539 RepID=A0A6U4GSV8_9ALVE
MRNTTCAGRKQECARQCVWIHTHTHRLMRLSVCQVDKPGHHVSHVRSSPPLSHAHAKLSSVTALLPTHALSQSVRLIGQKAREGCVPSIGWMCVCVCVCE